MPEEILDQDLVNINQDKESAMTFRERRHTDWNDNYTLYRDKIITNRLTQRQTVNIPLMKYGIQTILKDNDDLTNLYFLNLDNDQTKEILYNEYWKKVGENNRLVIRDRIDKKQACLYGRTFKKLNIADGQFTFEIIDPQDMLVDRYVDPADLDSTRSLVQTGIYKPLTEVINNELYDKDERARLKQYYDEESTEEESEENLSKVTQRAQRMTDMGLSDATEPLTGETYLELNEAYRKEYDEDKKENRIVVYIIAVTNGGTFKLFKKPLHELIGKTEDDFWKLHYPFTSWGTDPERLDFWSDGPADVIRQPNKVLNSWVSQLVENRTLKNMNMHYYDSSNPDFIPQTFTAESWGWYPTPGNPNDVIKDVAVGDLSNSLEELQFIISVAEKAVAASSAQTGQIEQRQVTLGEVQLALANAQERTKSMGAFIAEDWRDFGTKYIKMLEAHDIDTMTINKKGREGRKMYTRDIGPGDWDSKLGYSVEVRSVSDKQTEDENNLQKLNAAKTIMFDNMPLDTIYKKKVLEYAGLSAEETKEVIDFEKQKQNLLPMPGAMQPAGQPMGQPQPALVASNPQT